MKRINPGFKNLLLFLFLPVLCTKEASCQIRETGLIIPAKESFTTEIKITGKERIPVFRYGHIMVKDNRADKSKMGYVLTDSKKNKLQRIVFPKEGESYINKQFNQAILPMGNKDTVLILLYDIWFNETKTEATEAHKLLFGLEKLVSSCHLNADIFLQKDNRFIFVGNSDSIIFKKGEWLPNNCDKLLEKSVSVLLKKTDTVLYQQNETAVTFNKYQLDSILKNRAGYPILKAVKPAKGLYFTFDDFRNNKPADIDFTVVSDISRRISYPGMIKEDTLWGYSDGENIYMHIAHGFYLLNRAQNTYEVAGPAVVELINPFINKAMNVAVSYFSPPKGFINLMPFFTPNKYTINYYKYFRLDMRNGLLY